MLTKIQQATLSKTVAFVAEELQDIIITHSDSLAQQCTTQTEPDDFDLDEAANLVLKELRKFLKKRKPNIHQLKANYVEGYYDN